MTNDVLDDVGDVFDVRSSRQSCSTESQVVWFPRHFPRSTRPGRHRQISRFVLLYIFTDDDVENTLRPVCGSSISGSFPIENRYCNQLTLTFFFFSGVHH